MSLKDIDHLIEPNYFSANTDLVENFYNLVLTESVRYDRLAGYFSSGSLSVAAKGMTKLIENNGHIRLLCGVQLSEDDWDSISNPEQFKDLINKNFLDEYENLEDELIWNYTKVLGWMIANGILEVKIGLNYIGGKYEPGNIDGEGNFYVSNRKIDNTYNCWCNYNSKNNIISNFYTAIYNGGIYNGKLRSMSGYKLITKTSNNYSNTSTYAINDIVLYNSNMYICITAIETPEDFDNNKWQQIPINGGTTATQEINSAIANNTTSDVEWYIDVWSDRMLINGLLILMGKSLNSQAVFGRGLDTGGQTAKEAYITGTLNDKGLFWGVTSAGTSGVKVFGMENWWGCAFRRTAGLIGLANGNTAYKMTYDTADGTTANGYNTTGDGYHINTIVRPANGFVKSCKFGDFGYLSLNVTGGSASTYYADYWYTNNSALTFALVGGDSSNGASVGVSFFALGNAVSGAYWGLATSLTLKPLID